MIAKIGLVTAQHSLHKLDYPINTSTLHEICPVVSYDESVLFFTRVADVNCARTLVIDSVDVFKTLDSLAYDQKLKNVYAQLASSTVRDPIKSGYNQDIWYTNLKNGSHQGIFHPEYPINDVLPNSICANFGKNNAFLVINQFHPFGGIEKGFSITEKTGQDFTFPQPIKIKNFTKTSSEINITASLDSTILILAMAQGDNMDLFVSFRIQDDLYSEPVNMGSDINTPYRESTPMLTHDTKKLYFTSDRPDGFGGKDIYYSERLDALYTQWSTPKALFPPVNSQGDDSHPHLLKDNNTLYFSSGREGSSDIFKASLLRTKIDKDIILTFHIINEETGQKSPGELIWGNAYQKERPGYFRSKDGRCRYKFFENKPVVFSAFNRNLKSEEIIIDPQELMNAGIYAKTIELIMSEDGKLKIVKPLAPTLENDEEKLTQADLNNTILLHNIYFERTKPIVLPESIPSINKLAEVLLRRPRLYINIIGHTDNVGDPDALKTLSEERAFAIKKILVEKGVPEYRVSTAGYGGSHPIAPNDTEENKSKNRRVEIRIVSQ